MTARPWLRCQAKSWDGHQCAMKPGHDSHLHRWRGMYFVDGQKFWDMTLAPVCATSWYRKVVADFDDIMIDDEWVSLVDPRDDEGHVCYEPLDHPGVHRCWCGARA